MGEGVRHMRHFFGIKLAYDNIYLAATPLSIRGYGWAADVALLAME